MQLVLRSYFIFLYAPAKPAMCNPDKNGNSLRRTMRNVMFLAIATAGINRWI